MKQISRGLMLLVAISLISTSLFALEAPGDSKTTKNNPAKQAKPSVETDFTYIIKGYPEKIQWTGNGTYVACKGSSGRCVAMDFESGVAIVDPDGCNMGPTYIGCKKVEGDYWVLVKQTPELATWLLHELQLSTNDNNRDKEKDKDKP
jgi:hypothetical protein